MLLPELLHLQLLKCPIIVSFAYLTSYSINDNLTKFSSICFLSPSRKGGKSNRSQSLFDAWSSVIPGPSKVAISNIMQFDSLKYILLKKYRLINPVERNPLFVTNSFQYSN